MFFDNGQTFDHCLQRSSKEPQQKHCHKKRALPSRNIIRPSFIFSSEPILLSARCRPTSSPILANFPTRSFMLSSSIWRKKGSTHYLSSSASTLQTYCSELMASSTEYQVKQMDYRHFSRGHTKHRRIPSTGRIPTMFLHCPKQRTTRVQEHIEMGLSSTQRTTCSHRPSGSSRISNSEVNRMPISMKHTLTTAEVICSPLYHPHRRWTITGQLREIRSKACIIQPMVRQLGIFLPKHSISARYQVPGSRHQVKSAIRCQVHSSAPVTSASARQGHTPTSDQRLSSRENYNRILHYTSASCQAALTTKS